MSRPLTIVWAFLWSFAMPIVVAAGVGVMVLLRPSASTDLVTLGAWDALACVAITWALLRVHLPDRRALDVIGVRPTHPALAAIGLLLGVALSAPVDTLQALVEQFWPLSDAELAQRAELFHTESQLEVVAMMLTAACLVPFAEEVLFRGAIYAGLRIAYSGLLAAGLSGVCFVIVHLNPRDWLPLALVTAVLSHLRLVSGSLLPCIALHVGFNGLSIALVTTGIVPAYSRMHLPIQQAFVGWALCAALVFVAHRIAKTSSQAEGARADDARS